MSAPTPAGTLRKLAERYGELLVEELSEQVVSVVLFGSVARGDATANSDIDLLIVADALPAGQFARHAVLAAADRRFELQRATAAAASIDGRLSRIVRSREEAARIIPLYLDFTEDAVLLYDRDGFFAAVLDRLRQSLARLGSRRVRQGETWYWDLKPDFKAGEKFEI